MTYKVMLTVHDTDISEVLDSLGIKRGKYLLLALGEFLKTKKGRKTFVAMTSDKKEDTSEAKTVKKKKGDAVKTEVKTKPKIDLDSFL